VTPRVSKGYWIWGQFDLESTKQITPLHQGINKKLCGPNFDVHLTISGPVPYQEELHTPVLESISSRFIEFSIQLDGIGYKHEFFQSLFLNVVANKELKNLKKLIDRSFNIKRAAYFPHISLFYGNTDKNSKIDIVNESKPPISVVLDKISVVKVNEEIKSWKVLKTYPLLKNSTKVD